MEHKRKNVILLIAASALFLIFFGAVAIWKFAALHYNALDLAIFNQVFFNTLHGNWFSSSIHPPSYLRDHFSPVIFLLLPFYALAPHPLMLVALQITALIAGAWLVYLIALPRLGSRWAAALGTAWLVNPFIGNIALFEFSTLPFATLGALLAYIGYDKKKFWLFVGALLYTLLCREDMALGVLAFTALAIINRRETRWWITPLILAFGYTVVAALLVHAFAPSGQYKFWVYYQWLGSTPNEIFHTLVTKPLLPIAMLLRPGNVLFVLIALLPTAFLPLMAPQTLVLAAGFALQFMLGSAGAGLTVLQTQYAALFVAPIFIATVEGIVALRKTQTLKQHQPFGIMLFAATVAYAAYTLGPIPQSINAMTQDDKKIGPWQLINAIPDNAAVAATYDFLAPLSSRENLTSFNYAFLGKQQFLQKDYELPPGTEYLLIDFQDLVTYQLQYGYSPFYKKHYEQARGNWPKILNGFSVIAISDSTALFQRGEAPSIVLTKILDAQATTIEQPANTMVGDDLTYLGASRTDNHIQLFWRASLPSQIPYRLKIQLQKSAIYLPFAYDLLFGAPTTSEAYVQTNIWHVPDGILEFSIVTVDGGGIDVDGARGTHGTVDGEQILTPTVTVW